MTPESTQAGAMVAGTIIFAVALVGFFSGTSTKDYDFVTPLREVPVSVQRGEILPARTYVDMRNQPRAAPVLPESVGKLEAKVPTRLDPVNLDGTSKEADLALRASRRAYNGAPPVIPHPVVQRQMSECKTCHDKGIRFGGLRAPPFPHEAFESCTQCHAMMEPTPPWGRGRSEGLREDPRAVVNSFEGWEAPKKGNRWTGIAPPEIPHDTFLHERCISCHGPNGKDAMKATHPSRQSCSQCHPRNSTLEQRPGGKL